MTGEDEAFFGIMRPDEVDIRVSRAVVRAAGRAAPEPQDRSFLERRLEDALVHELGLEFPGGDVVARKKLPGVTLPDWDPSPVPSMSPCFVAST